MKSTAPAISSEIRPVQWNGQFCTLIDQTVLPHQHKIVKVHTAQQMAEAIRMMIVRGAPAIGVAAAFGMVLGFREMNPAADRETRLTTLDAVADRLRGTRPTAVNLFWAIERMLMVARTEELSCDRLEREALAILNEDILKCQTIGKWGLSALPSIPHRLRLLTHCNTGSLATAGYGTALGIVRSAWRVGRLERVYANETRPRLQGARLTAWELVQESIPVTVLADTMAANCLSRGMIDAVVVGADRITANGDTANKIGTYGLAILANYHGIPFYVAAPWSTVDQSLPDGTHIPIEERDPNEVHTIDGTVICPLGTEFYNPAFDVTPAALVTGIITESGVYAPADLCSKVPRNSP
jgi:methylthioribose-1-phosphate isomerase